MPGRELEFGFNVLEKMFSKALGEYGCEEIDCMVYNANLDYVLDLFEKYDTLSNINIYSNSENISVSYGRIKEVEKKMKESERLSLFHISENEQILHAKVYRFWKDGRVKLGTIGSPNLNPSSNRNLEILYFLEDVEIINNIWNGFEEVCSEHELSLSAKIPQTLLPVEEKPIEDKYLEGLWEHQKEILRWLARRKFSVINIPAGTGKTRVALRRVKHILDNERNTTILILVPTKVLIQQWRAELESWEIKTFELGPSIEEELEYYFGNPKQKAVITLYSRIKPLHKDFLEPLKIDRPDIIIISDECQKWYRNLDFLQNFVSSISKNLWSEIYHIGLSATLGTFRKEVKERFLQIMGGEVNRYKISLPSFYSKWNDLNERPILKPIKYIPLKCPLSSSEWKKYRKLSKKVAMELGRKSFASKEYTASMKRADWVRSLKGGIERLYDFLASHIEMFSKGNSLIFVQSNRVAEKTRDFITSQPGWDEESSAYVYDSSRADSYKGYAMKQFKKGKGFCLISERMLREGFDLPKISRVVLHGSHASPKDWLQKIGRAIRYDPESPESVAEIIDVVFLDPKRKILPMEKERYETLQSVSL